MRIGFAQINATVGDITGNTNKISEAYRELSAAGADVVITPELAISGYPPQDLVFKSSFVPQNLQAVGQLHAEVSSVPLVVGYIERNSGPGAPFHNAAAVLQQGQP